MYTMAHVHGQLWYTVLARGQFNGWDFVQKQGL